VYGYISAVLADKGSDVYTTGPSVTVRQAAREMNLHGVGALLVMSKDRPVGILTERDILRRVVDPGLTPDATRVSAVMTHDILAIAPTMAVTDAMDLMTRHRCRHLPVLEHGRVTGIVSIGDLLRWVGMHQEAEIQTLTDYIRGGQTVA